MSDISQVILDTVARQEPSGSFLSFTITAVLISVITGVALAFIMLGLLVSHDVGWERRRAFFRWTTGILFLGMMVLIFVFRSHYLHTKETSIRDLRSLALQITPSSRFIFDGRYARGIDRNYNGFKVVKRDNGATSDKDIIFAMTEGKLSFVMLSLSSDRKAVFVKVDDDSHAIVECNVDSLFALPFEKLSLVNREYRVDILQEKERFENSKPIQ